MKNTDVNKVILKGRVGKDPQISSTTNGTVKCVFSVATNKSWKDKTGEWKKVTNWSNIVVWGKLAEVVGQCVKMGDIIALTGELNSRSYEDKAGVKKYITEVVADDVDLIQAWPKAETKGGTDTPQDLPF